MKLSTEKLYYLCNKYRWFTSGDCRQYELLFECNKQNAPTEKLATIIWICSINYSEESILEILKKECDING